MSSCNYFENKTIPVGNYQMICGYTEDDFNQQRKKDPLTVKCNTYCDDAFYYRSFISLKDSNKFVMGLDDILLSGKYRFDDDQLILEDDSQEVIALEITQKELNYIQLSGNFTSLNTRRLPNSEKLYLNFELDKTFIREKPNKYEKEINIWRNLPIATENRSQIKQRTLNNLDYTIAYFQHFLDLGIVNNLKVEGVEGPILFGANGIALRTWEDVPSDWKSLYFDEDNARLAYDFLVEGFRKVEKVKYNLSGSLLVVYYLKDYRQVLSTM